MALFCLLSAVMGTQLWSSVNKAYNFKMKTSQDHSFHFVCQSIPGMTPPNLSECQRPALVCKEVALRCIILKIQVKVIKAL